MERDQRDERGDREIRDTPDHSEIRPRESCSIGRRSGTAGSGPFIEHFRLFFSAIRSPLLRMYHTQSKELALGRTFCVIEHIEYRTLGGDASSNKGLCTGLR